MSVRRARPVQAKHLFFVFFALLTLFVIYRNELPLLDAHSPVWAHFAPVTWWLLPHGLGGALALLLAPLQFSNRLRQRNLRLHRVLGRLYVACVIIAAPVAIVIAVIQGPPTLVMAAVIQSGGWLVTTGVALYCVRSGNIKQHREWMIRSYPFAMVFVFTRVLFAVPAIQRLGEVGIVSVVWSVIAAACFIPSFIINWRAMFPRKAVAPAPNIHAPALEVDPATTMP
ncbi:MAG: DUF2306 domain-containing protein [Pyrinomonadaceae bacterium]